MFLLVCVLAGARSEDVGYENLFEDVLDEVDTVPLKFDGSVPGHMVGTFAQTGPARWSWGERKMTHVLDGYSKIHKWEFTKDNVFFTSKFVRSGFYMESEKLNDIALGVMAQATTPPLKVSMEAFLKSPNDNNQVNVIQLGDGNFELLSDTLSLVELDRSSVELTQEYNYRQCKNNVPNHCTVTINVSNPLGQLNTGASAHPHFTQEGDYIGVREMAKYAGIIPGKEGFAVYRIKKDQRDTIQDLVRIPVKKTSYTHSFGLAHGVDGDHVIICAQPIHYDSLAMAQKATLDVGLVKSSDNNRFYIAPLQFGAEAIEIELPEAFYFGHVVNSYSPKPGTFVIDINKEHNIFFDRYSLHVQRSKTLRDAWPTTASDGVVPGFATVTRYTISLETKNVTSVPLFGHQPEENIFNEHDLFKLHPADYGKPYCGYWAWQAYYNSTSFASWAVVRTELCGEQPVVAAAWHRPNFYPGEASFVPKPGSSDKTAGTITFHAYDGNSGRSLLVIADAKTLETITEAVLPVNVPFTVHGNWFSALPPSPPTPDPVPAPTPAPPSQTHYGKPPCLSDEKELALRHGVVCAPKCKGFFCPGDKPIGSSNPSCNSMMVDPKIPKNYCVVQCFSDAGCGQGATCAKRNPFDFGVCVYSDDGAGTISV